MDTPADADTPERQPQRKYKPRPKLNSTLAGVLAHPLRCKIQTILDRRAASASQVSGAIGVSLGTISYHFREMVKMGVIESVGTRERRGATETFLRGTIRPELSDEEFAELSLDERHALSLEVLQLLCADAGSSLAERLFAARADNYIYRNPFWVDEEGWQELGAVFDAAKEGVEDVFAAVVNRKAANPALRTFCVTTGLTFFETPEYELADADEVIDVPVSADPERLAAGD